MTIKLSSKTHYGLRAMVGLARAYGYGPVTLTEISQTEGISLRYLEQLAAKLRRAGLVQATRGVQGGYQLKTDPTSITVGEVLRALEGPINLAQCSSEVNTGICSREAVCSSREVWRRVNKAVVEVLDSITLSDLCSEDGAERNLTNV